MEIADPLKSVGPQKHLAERALTIQMNAKAAYWLSEQIRHFAQDQRLAVIAAQKKAAS